MAYAGNRKNVKTMVKLNKYIQYSFWFFLILLILCSFIPTGVLTNNQTTSENLIRTDYLLHFAAFFSFALLYFFAYPMYFSYSKIKKIIIFCLGIFFASAMEILHYYIPYRSFNPRDLFFNLSGLVSGLLITILIFNFIKRKN